MSHLIESIAKRYSPVSFTETPISREALNTLFEAARRAPSSYNEQPWRFIYATKENPEQYRRMLNTLMEVNKKWAQTAPVLMLSVAKKQSIVTHRPNPYAFHDTGMAIANLLAQATSMGIYVHQMGGYDRKKAQRDLHIPEGYEPVAMAALGYPGDLDKRPAEIQKKAKQKSGREPIDEFVCEGKWNFSS